MKINLTNSLLLTALAIFCTGAVLAEPVTTNSDLSRSVEDLIIRMSLEKIAEETNKTLPAVNHKNLRTDKLQVTGNRTISYFYTFLSNEIYRTDPVFFGKVTKAALVEHFKNDASIKPLLDLGCEMRFVYRYPNGQNFSVASITAADLPGN